MSQPFGISNFQFVCTCDLGLSARVIWEEGQVFSFCLHVLSWRAVLSKTVLSLVPFSLLSKIQGFFSHVLCMLKRKGGGNNEEKNM